MPVQSGTDQRYAPACIKLLAQYKSLMKLVDIDNVKTFMKRFKVGRVPLRRVLIPDGPSSSIT